MGSANLEKWFRRAFIDGRESDLLEPGDKISIYQIEAARKIWTNLRSTRSALAAMTAERDALRAQLAERRVVVPRDCGSCSQYQDKGDATDCDGCGDDPFPNWIPSRALSGVRAVGPDEMVVKRDTLNALRKGGAT